jgi:predicted nucleic-acid-binding Zn-ribbon protein
MTQCKICNDGTEINKFIHIHDNIFGCITICDKCGYMNMLSMKTKLYKGHIELHPFTYIHNNEKLNDTLVIERIALPVPSEQFIDFIMNEVHNDQ